jgi:hypothetical protein
MPSASAWFLFVRTQMLISPPAIPVRTMIRNTDEGEGIGEGSMPKMG